MNLLYVSGDQFLNKQDNKICEISHVQEDKGPNHIGGYCMKQGSNNWFWTEYQMHYYSKPLLKTKLNYLIRTA